MRLRSTFFEYISAVVLLGSKSMNNIAEIISVKYNIVVPNTCVNPVLLLWQFLMECAFHKLTGNGQSRKIGGGEKRYPLLFAM
jgi:hypothetical protein